MNSQACPHHSEPDRQEISARAWQIWRIAGHPHDRDLEFWLAAEARVNREREEISRALSETPRAA